MLSSCSSTLTSYLSACIPSVVSRNYEAFRRSGCFNGMTAVIKPGLLIFVCLCAGLSAFMGSFDFALYLMSIFSGLSTVTLLGLSWAKYLGIAAALLSTLVNALTKYDSIKNLSTPADNENATDLSKEKYLYIILGIYAAFASAILATEGVETSIFLLTSLCGLVPSIISWFFGFLNLLATAPQNYDGLKSFREKTTVLMGEIANANQNAKGCLAKGKLFSHYLLKLVFLVVLMSFSILGRVGKCLIFFQSLQSVAEGGGDACQEIQRDLYYQSSSPYSDEMSYDSGSLADMSSFSGGPTQQQLIYYFLSALGGIVGVSANLITGLLLVMKSVSPLRDAFSAMSNAAHHACSCCFRSNGHDANAAAPQANTYHIMTKITGVILTSVLTFFYAINYPGYTLNTLSNVLGDSVLGQVFAWLGTFLAAILPFTYGYTSTYKHVTANLLPYIDSLVNGLTEISGSALQLLSGQLVSMCRGIMTTPSVFSQVPSYYGAVAAQV